LAGFRLKTIFSTGLNAFLSDHEEDSKSTFVALAGKTTVNWRMLFETVAELEKQSPT